MSKYELVNSFVNYMKDSYEITYTDKQIKNFEILYETLESKSKIANVLPLPMGDGKSTFIEFYCNYKYDTDPEFSAVITKKTIDEADGFCSNLGVKNNENKYLYEGFGRIEYYGDRISTNGLLMYDRFPEYKKMKAFTLKGFNFKDCIKYKNINAKNNNNVIGEKHLIATEYDNRLCATCNQVCYIKNLKYHIKNFRVISISHNRLFWSNNLNEILDTILYYENDKGEKVKRKLLIIDEKMSMFYREILKIEDFNQLKNYINNGKGTNEDKELIAKYEKAIMELEFGIYNNDFKILDNSINIHEKFSEDLSKQIFKFAESKELESAISFLEKVSNFPKIMTYINKNQNPKKDNREISIAQYLDLSNYSKHFENTVITDATAILDLEYSKSNAIINNNIEITRKPINLYIPTNACSFSRQAINKNYKDMVQNIGEECTNIINQDTSLKTLVVTYMWVLNKEDTFLQDIEKNIKADKDLYKIIYFGEYTTGVNHLSKYQNIIFIGQLRKGSSYEKAKEYVFDNKYSQEEIRNNEFLIGTIQQIGRTSYRKNLTPNVYIFEKQEIIDSLTKGLSNFFEMNILEYNNTILYRERKPRYGGKCKTDSWYWKFLVFVATEKGKNHIAKQVYLLDDIKKAINYNLKDHKKAFLDKASNFIIYDKKNKTVTIDFEKAQHEIRFNDIDTYLLENKGGILM